MILFCYRLIGIRAPVVDSIFVKKFGRRKSWVVPMQCIIGLYMIFFSTYVHRLLEVDVSASASDTKRGT
jgi:PAT family acetyl-CoA transporter-like MFS transporter 1